MKYCPHCSRPTARVSGPCPHCGKELSGDNGPSALAPEVVAAVSAPSAAPAPVASGSSGLELDTAVYENVPRSSRIPGISSGAVAPSIVDAAGFGKAEPGLLGAMAYWMRVRRRLRGLRQERAAADEICIRAQQARMDRAAQLGRSAYRLGVRSSDLDRLVSAARTIEEALKHHESQRSVRLSAHTQRLDVLAAEMQSVEAEAAPLRENERRLSAETKQLELKKRGFETTRKRHRIDLENTEALLMPKRQSFEHLPLPEQEKVEREIEALEARRQSLTVQLAQMDASLASLTVPAEKLLADINTAALALAPYNEKRAAIHAQIESAKTEAAETERAESTAFDTAVERISLAWAEAGLQVIKEHIRHPDLDGERAAVIQAVRDAADAESTAEMLAGAEDRYDHRVVRTAQRALVAIVAAAVLLIAALIVL